MIVRFGYMNGEFFDTEIGVGDEENKFEVVGGGAYKVYHLEANMIKRIFNINFTTYYYNKNFALTDNNMMDAHIILKHKEKVLKKILRRRKINNLLNNGL